MNIGLQRVDIYFTSRCSKKYHKDYKQVILGTYFMFGCPYSCSFCEQGTSLWKNVTRRPIEQIFKEVDFLLGFKNVQEKLENVLYIGTKKKQVFLTQNRAQ